jgi:hypothetical protein
VGYSQRIDTPRALPKRSVPSRFATPVHAAANPNAELLVELEEPRKQIPRRAWNQGARIIARAVGDSMHGGDDPIRDGALVYLKPTRSMVCGPIEFDPADPRQTTITNPTLIVEVLSPTTEEVDRGDKWRDDQRIPSLLEYVLVSQKTRIEIYRRTSSGGWEYLDVREGIVKLASGAQLDLSILSPAT